MLNMLQHPVYVIHLGILNKTSNMHSG